MTISDYQECLDKIRLVAELSAAVLRDPERNGGWEGAEKVARQFDRIAQIATPTGVSSDISISKPFGRY